MIRGQTLLFDLTVEHSYFSDPEDCRLRFQPDAASAAWFHRADLAVRSRTNRIQIYCADERLSAARRLSPLAVGFWVNGVDPLFGSYTGGLDMPPDLADFGDLDPVGPLFDLASAEPDTVGTAVAGPWVPCCPLDAGPRRPTRQGFRVSAPLAWPPQPERFYSIKLEARSLVWKYLLAKDAWGKDAPRLVERDPGANPGLLEPVGFLPGPAESLADGRTALTFVSSKPLPIQDRSSRRVAMWADAGVNQGRVIMPTLPNPSAANLARAGPGSDQLVVEILVPS